MNVESKLILTVKEADLVTLDEGIYKQAKRVEYFIFTGPFQVIRQMDEQHKKPRYCQMLNT